MIKSNEGKTHWPQAAIARLADTRGYANISEKQAVEKCYQKVDWDQCDSGNLARIAQGVEELVSETSVSDLPAMAEGIRMVERYRIARASFRDVAIALLWANVEKKRGQCPQNVKERITSDVLERIDDGLPRIANSGTMPRWKQEIVAQVDVFGASHVCGEWLYSWRYDSKYYGRPWGKKTKLEKDYLEWAAKEKRPGKAKGANT